MAVKVNIFPIKLKRYEDAEVVIENWQMGQTQGYQNRVVRLNLENRGAGTTMTTEIVKKFGEPNKGLERLKVGVPEARIFDFGEIRQWVIYGIVPNRSQKGKRIRGKFVMIICNEDEAGEILIERFGIEETLSAVILKKESIDVDSV